MSDKYDEQIKYLTKRPEKILKQWENCKGLFRYATPDDFEYSHATGCLTMIRKNEECMVPDHPELTKAIKTDNRIPLTPREITPEHLPVFAEWQRRLDREIRTPKAEVGA